MTTDPYKVLGVSPTADDKEIKEAYKKLVKKYKKIFTKKVAGKKVKVTK